MECKTIDFLPDGNVKFNFYSNTKPYSVPGIFLVDATAKGVIRATFQFSDVMGSRADGDVTWRILKTDYKNYAIIASCYEEGIINKEFVYMIVRDPELSQVEKSILDIEFMNVHYPQGGEMEEQNLSSCFESTKQNTQKHELVRNTEKIKQEQNLQELLRQILFPTSDGNVVAGPSDVPHSVVIRILDGKIIVNGHLDTPPIILDPETYPQIFAPGILPTVSLGGESSVPAMVVPFESPNPVKVINLGNQEQNKINQKLEELQKFYQSNPELTTHLPGAINSVLKGDSNISPPQYEEIKIENDDSNSEQIITDMIQKLYRESQQISARNPQNSNIQVTVLPEDDTISLRKILMNSMQL